jgi:hypothetical protein
MKTQIFKSIFIFCIFTCAFTKLSSAQIIYTDIIPDYTLNKNSVYQLDLNNYFMGTLHVDLAILIMATGIHHQTITWL